MGEEEREDFSNHVISKRKEYFREHECYCFYDLATPRAFMYLQAKGGVEGALLFPNLAPDNLLFPLDRGDRNRGDKIAHVPYRVKNLPFIACPSSHVLKLLKAR